MTALGYASSEGHSAVVCLLLQAGASMDLRDYCGRTPLGYAASEGQHSDETMNHLQSRRMAPVRFFLRFAPSPFTNILIRIAILIGIDIVIIVHTLSSARPHRNFVRRRPRPRPHHHRHNHHNHQHHSSSSSSSSPPSPSSSSSSSPDLHIFIFFTIFIISIIIFFFIFMPSCILSGHLEIVRLLLEAGVDKNARDCLDGMTALSYASLCASQTLEMQGLHIGS